jgi:hypothetical protein
VYGKIFETMYKGTLYGHWEAIVTFQQMIVLADADGIVDMTPQAICAHTSIPIDIIEKGIQKLSEPDQFSRTPGEDGKRIVCIDEHRPWGWQIVNYLKYKHLKDSDEVREQNRIRAQRFRDKRNAPSRSVTPSNTESRHTDTDTDTDTDKRKRTSNGRAIALPDWLPKEPWDAWLEVRSKNRAPNTPRALRLAITELAKLKAAGQDVQAILEQSTLRGWRGVFAVKSDSGAPIDYEALQRKLEDEEKQRAGV